MEKSKIFLVEDERIVAKDVESILTGLGYDVVGSAASGNEAIKKVNEANPDLILMDIKIKGDMDGIETAKKILDSKDIPIIYLTAFADNKTLERAKITAPLGYIVKPFHDKELHTAIEVALYRHKIEKENRKLSEKIVKLTKKIPLTDNEKAVFYAIVRYPLLNDIGLAKKLKIKRSTITAIRNRLKAEKMYATYRIPNFSLLGCELLAVMHAKINPIAAGDKLHLLGEIASNPEQVMITSTNREFMGIAIAANFTELNRHFDDVSRKFKENNFTGDLSTLYFPFEFSSIMNLFDYSSLLNNLFELSLKDEPKKIVKPKQRKLTKKEGEILAALVSYPEMNDSEIAEKARLPRTTISQSRRRLIDDGILEIVNIPNLMQLRCELLVTSHIQHSDGRLNEHIRQAASTVFLVQKGNESFSLNAYNDYTEYEIEMNGNIRFYSQNKMQVEKQEIDIFPVTQIQFEKLDFAGLARKLLKS